MAMTNASAHCAAYWVVGLSFQNAITRMEATAPMRPIAAFIGENDFAKISLRYGIAVSPISLGPVDVEICGECARDLND